MELDEMESKPKASSFDTNLGSLPEIYKIEQTLSRLSKL
jgi:hypothetical protein